MHQLTAPQRELVAMLVDRLSHVDGVCAVVLGGSHARGRAHAASDIDLGLLYSEAAPFSIEAVRELAASLQDTDAGPAIVSGFYGWGPWVNGGAWLTIGGQRVDFLYRNIEHVGRVIDQAVKDGAYEVHFLQQPPFGFFSGTYLGEVAVCISLHDPDGLVAELKSRVATYPEALRQRLIQDYLFMANFTLSAFAPKMHDLYGTAACLTRAAHELIMVLFAMNRRYLVNEKSALAEVAEFPKAPPDFARRVTEILGGLDRSLPDAVARMRELAAETAALAD